MRANKKANEYSKKIELYDMVIDILKTFDSKMTVEEALSKLIFYRETLVNERVRETQRYYF